jgi:hypothetical protein
MCSSASTRRTERACSSTMMPSMRVESWTPKSSSRASTSTSARTISAGIFIFPDA